MFERFTDRARRVLVLAREEARLLNHDFIGTEHILLGLIHEGEGVAAMALRSLDISLDMVREKVEEAVRPSGPERISSPPFTPRAKKVLELALREALQLGHNYIGTEHMLLGIIREGEGVAAQVLIGLGASLTLVRQRVVELLSGPAPRGGRRQVGVSWQIEVVHPGRTAEAFEEASRTLADLVKRLEQSKTFDASRVEVSSVGTDDGPGLYLAVRGPAEVAPAPEAGSGGGEGGPAT